MFFGRSNIAVKFACLLADAFLMLLVPETGLRAESRTQPADSLAIPWDVSLKTNLVWAAAAEPNLAFDVMVGNHFSIGLNGGLKPWPRWMVWDWDNSGDNVHWRNFAVVPYFRWWPSRVYDGWYAGTDFVYTHFNVGHIKFPSGIYQDAYNYRLQGSFWGAGAVVGYSWWLSDKWRLEAEAGIAGGLAAYSKYDCPHCGTRLSDERHPVVVPKVGVNVAYNFLERSRRVSQAATIVMVGEGDVRTIMTPSVAFVVHLRDAVAPETTGDRLSAEDPWILPVGSYRPLDYLTRPGRDSILCVQYPVDQWALDPDFASNGRTMEKLVSSIRSLQEDSRTKEILLSVVGLASIEGPSDRNDTLSRRRAASVAEFIMKETGLSRRQIEIIGKGEAWDWFAMQLKSGHPAFTQEEISKLREIISGTPDLDKRERLIRSDAALYAKVRKHLLADQRSAGYIRVYYGNGPHLPTQKLNETVYEYIKARNYKDAVKTVSSDPAMLELVNNNAEAANAYGIALYFTALDNKDAQMERAAIEFVKRAASMGSRAAEMNLKGIETYGPARKEYEAWLESRNNN